MELNGLAVPPGPRLSWLVRQFCERERPKVARFETDKRLGKDYTIEEVW